MRTGAMVGVGLLACWGRRKCPVVPVSAKAKMEEGGGRLTLVALVLTEAALIAPTRQASAGLFLSLPPMVLARVAFFW